MEVEVEELEELYKGEVEVVVFGRVTVFGLERGDEMEETGCIRV